MITHYSIKLLSMMDQENSKLLLMDQLDFTNGKLKEFEIQKIESRLVKSSLYNLVSMNLKIWLSIFSGTQMASTQSTKYISLHVFQHD